MGAVCPKLGALALTSMKSMCDLTFVWPLLSVWQITVTTTHALNTAKLAPSCAVEVPFGIAKATFRLLAARLLLCH